MAAIETLSNGKQYVKEVFDKVKKRNPNEPEFHQAVIEILESLTPVFDKHPQYMQEGILRKNCGTRKTNHV